MAAVNVVVGDAGFIAHYGRAPSGQDNEVARIRAHLVWVVSQLREADVQHLGVLARERRARLLDGLQRYAVRGRFPRNRYRQERCPVFIDDRGVVCAVGHLMELSCGRALVEGIAASHRLSLVSEIDRPEVDDWARAHGFSRQELAIIQPAYSGDPYNLVPTDSVSQWVAVVVLGAASLALAGVSSSLRAWRAQRAPGWPVAAFAVLASIPSLWLIFMLGPSRYLPVVAVVAAASLAFLGVAHWPERRWSWAWSRRISVLLFVLGFGAVPWLLVVAYAPWKTSTAHRTGCSESVDYEFYVPLWVGNGQIRHGWTHLRRPGEATQSAYYLFGHAVKGEPVNEVMSCRAPGTGGSFLLR